MPPETGRPSPSEAHRVAHRYWERCTNTFLTNPEYYEQCQRTLDTEILPKLGYPTRSLDSGCGNGLFTFTLARVSRTVDAFDLSSALIAEARQMAHERGVTNVRFSTNDVTRLDTECGGYDLVACMGVTSTIIDDWAFNRTVRALTAAIVPGGLLLLRDSLSRLPEGQLVESSDYATRYRNVDAYRQAFAELGLSLDLEIPLVEFGTSVNGFFLFRAQVGSPAAR